VNEVCAVISTSEGEGVVSILGDVRALVRLLEVSAGDATGHAPGDPRQPPDETEDDLLLEDGDTDGATPGASHGIWIAAATFVPTFLAIIFGAAYLAGPPSGTRVLAGFNSGPVQIVSSLAPQAGLAAPPRPVEAPMRSSVEAKAAELRRSPRAPIDAAWIRGAAFPDRDSAESLAISIELQGYPVRVGRGDTSATPWVVWIGKYPSRMTSSGRRE
jgi:hypothetical protein